MEQPKKTSASTLFTTLGIAWGFGYTIAIPLVVLALLGRWVDNHWHTSPWGLIAGILLSIVISSVGLVMKFTKLMAEINSPTKDLADQQTKKQ